EEGYNTNARPLELQTKEPTRAILLSEVPRVNVGGVEYFEFTLDVNEASSGGRRRIVLNELRLYTAEGIDTLHGYDAATRTLGGFAPLYDFDTYVMGALVEDNSILIDGSGSGATDMSFLVPVSNFGMVNPATTY